MHLFDLLGTTVAVDDEITMKKMQTITGMMGAYYAFLKTCHEWLIESGVGREDSSRYTGALMHCVAIDGKNVGGSGFDGLIGEQSKGGYNEQGIRELTEAGVWDEVRNTLTSLNARWEGRAMGSELRPHRQSTCNWNYRSALAGAAFGFGLACVFFAIPKSRRFY